MENWPKLILEKIAKILGMLFGEYFQTVLAKSGSGYKPVLHSIAATNTIWIVTSFYTGSILKGGLKKSNSKPNYK